MFVIKRTRTTSEGRTVVQYIAGGVAPGFQTPGNTSCGVGVANLRKWKTREGALRFLKRYQFPEGLGGVEVVEC